MKLRGIDFGHVFNASGARNFTGRGWLFHRILHFLGLLTYRRSTFVSKTTTLSPNPGNLKLREDGLTPQKLFPDCVVVKWFKGVVLNAVGLSGRGAEWLLNHLDLTRMTEPFILSFSAIKKTGKERLIETRRFANLLQQVRLKFVAPFAIQLNISCPNVGEDWIEAASEAQEMMTIIHSLGIPILLKINVLMNTIIAAELAAHPGCDALVISNSIPYNQMEKRIPWKKLFGSNVSPLAKYGGGGLSGKPLLPLVLEWITQARIEQFPKPIVGCGGILSKQDAREMLKAGASAIEIGSASILRPWRIRGIIRYVNKHLAHVGT